MGQQAIGALVGKCEQGQFGGGGLFGGERVEVTLHGAQRLAQVVLQRRDALCLVMQIRDALVEPGVFYGIHLRHYGGLSKMCCYAPHHHADEDPPQP